MLYCCITSINKWFTSAWLSVESEWRHVGCFTRSRGQGKATNLGSHRFRAPIRALWLTSLLVVKQILGSPASSIDIGDAASFWLAESPNPGKSQAAYWSWRNGRQTAYIIMIEVNLREHNGLWARLWRPHADPCALLQSEEHVGPGPATPVHDFLAAPNLWVEGEPRKYSPTGPGRDHSGFQTYRVTGGEPLIEDITAGRLALLHTVKSVVISPASSILFGDTFSIFKCNNTLEASAGPSIVLEITGTGVNIDNVKEQYWGKFYTNVPHVGGVIRLWVTEIQDLFWLKT